jgi:phosphoglucosamine mutase
MSRKYFGTDGVRGRVGQPPLTVDFALRLASAAARVLAPNGGKVLVGKDTRLSGYMFEAALEAGFVAAGVDVLMIGPLPTPAIAYLTQKFECNFGAVISASHNLYEDNGIKFFCNRGGKLTDEAEAEIERHLDEPPVTRESPQLGTARRVDKSRVHYQQFCSSTIPAGMDLSGLKIVMDCAHGAGYKVGPRTLTDLGAEVIPIGCSPNGRNINLNCGSTSPQLLQMMVPGVQANLGIALDGDGDRLVMVDHTGKLIDGDQLLFIIAKARKASGQLVGPVVGTVMSNLGLEHALAQEGIAFKRAKVGDRYVLEMLRETGGFLGGETSGHLLCLDKTTTGDALISALQVLAILKQSGRTLAELAAPMSKYPQILENVRIAKKIDVNASVVIQNAVKQAEQRLNGTGRVVLRPSGTEPVIRVMVEGREEVLVRQLAKELASSVAAAAAG